MTKEPCISIIGLGLMGASLALALRKRGYAGRLAAYARKEETRREALARGIVDEACDDPDAAVQAASLVVLCAPIRSCAELAADVAPVLRPGTLVTDVGNIDDQSFNQGTWEGVKNFAAEKGLTENVDCLLGTALAVVRIVLAGCHPATSETEKHRTAVEPDEVFL